jgi:hypothetical protein
MAVGKKSTTRPRWKDIFLRAYSCGPTRCSCGVVLVSQHLLRYHWRAGHLDKLGRYDGPPSGETTDESTVVGFLDVSQGIDGHVFVNFHLKFPIRKDYGRRLPSTVIKWAKTCVPGDAFVLDGGDRVVVRLNCTLDETSTKKRRPGAKRQ